MPARPAELAGTWVNGTYNKYPKEGNVAKVRQLIDIAVAFRTDRKVNIFCGEFGVYMKSSKDADRVYWYSEVRKYLEETGIPWTIWDCCPRSAMLWPSSAADMTSGSPYRREHRMCSCQAHRRPRFTGFFRKRSPM